MVHKWCINVNEIKNKPKGLLCKPLGLSNLLAGATRLELATSGVTGRRSNQLNYAPVWRLLLESLRMKRAKSSTRDREKSNSRSGQGRATSQT